MLLSSSVDRAGGAPILTGGMPSLFASSKPNCRARSLAHSVALTHISRIIDGSLVASPRCRVCSANTDFIAFSRFRCIILLKLIEEYASKPRRQCAWVSKRDRSKFTFFKALTISFLSFLNTLRSSLYATSRDVSSTPRYIERRQEGFRVLHENELMRNENVMCIKAANRDTKQQLHTVYQDVNISSISRGLECVDNSLEKKTPRL